MKRFLLVLPLLAVPSGCADLTIIEDEGCGNRVINLNEDCDTKSPYGDEDSGEDDGTCGEAGTEHACFFTCTYGAADPGCPTTDLWTCGTDGRCRRPSGTFELQLGTATSFVENFAIGDVDGDGIPDLLGSDGIDISVRYGDGDGAFSDGFTKQIPPPTGPVTVAHLDDDTLLDMVVPIGFGFFTLKGTDERTLEPYNYAPFNIPSRPGEEPPDTIRVVAMQAVAECVYEGATFPDPAVEHLLIAGDFMTFAETRDQMIAAPTPTTWTAAEVAGRPATADLDDDMVSEVALTFTGDSQVYFYTARGVYDEGCAEDPIAVGPLRPEPFVVTPGGPGQGHIISLGEYVAHEQGVRFMDMDNDDDLDLVIAATTDVSEEEEPTNHVLWSPNLGNGQFEPIAMRVPFFCDRYQGAYEPDGACAYDRPWPLAVGHFDSDDRLDYVFSDQVVLSRFTIPPNTPVAPGPPPPLDEPAEEPFVEVGIAIGEVEWDEAVVLDLNGDGALDVAASSSEERGVDVFLNAAHPTLPGYFNPFRLHTDEPVRNLRVGDYDGDLLADVAFLQGHLDVGRDSLSVIYGSVSGGPSEVIDMGEVGTVQSMDRTSFLISPSGYDLIDDLMYVASPYVPPPPDGPMGGGMGGDEMTPSPAVALMFGDSSRTMVSPFFMDLLREDVFPAAAVSGRFGNLTTQETDPRDVVLVYWPFPEDGQDPNSFLALMVGVGGEGDVKFQPDQLAGLPKLSEFDTACALWTVGTLFGGTGDALIGVDHGPNCGESESEGPQHRIIVMPDLSSLIPAGDPMPVELPPDISNLDPIDWQMTILSGSLIGDTRNEVLRIELVDVDANGALDLLVALGGEDDNGRILILWNDERCPDGKVLCEQYVTPIVALDDIEDDPMGGGAPPGQEEPLTDVRGVILDVAAIQVDADKELELLVITNNKLWIGDFSKNTQLYDKWSNRDYGDNREEELDGAVRIGDINGDGLTDVVANTQERLRVLLQREQEPVGQTLDRDPDYLERFEEEDEEDDE